MLLSGSAIQPGTCPAYIDLHSGKNKRYLLDAWTNNRMAKSWLRDSLLIQLRTWLSFTLTSTPHFLVAGHFPARRFFPGSTPPWIRICQPSQSYIDLLGKVIESLHVWFRTSLGWKTLPLFSQGQQAQ